MFLPDSWGKGYATEALKAVLESCQKDGSLWAPFSKVYVRAIVNEENPASMRVMDKVGMAEKGVYEWHGEKLFLAGEWRTEDRLHIYGMYLIES
jgi:RimJ/RimL family protein N-acetyltransferase